MTRLKAALSRLNITISLSLTLLSTFSFAEPVRYYAVESNAAPFQMSENGQAAGGIITDIATQLFSKLNIPLETHVAPSLRIESTLVQDQDYDWVAYDAKAWNSLSNGEMINVPLFDVHHALMHCKPKLKPPINLNGMHIAILKGFLYPELSDLSLAGKLSLLETRHFDQAIQLVELERVSGFVEMGVRLEYQLSQLTKKKDCLTLSDISHVIKPYSIYLAVNVDMAPERKQGIRDQLSAMRSNGSIEKIWSKYSDRPYTLGN